MKRFGILAGAAAAVLVALGAYGVGVTKFTTDQANVAGTPTALNLAGVSAANGTSRAFATVDHTHAITGTLGGPRGGTGVSGSPLLMATTVAAQSIPASAATTVVYGTVETDTDSAYNATTGVFTVPTGKGGHYMVSCGASFSSAITATDVDIGIAVAGTVKRSFRVSNPAAAQTVDVSGAVFPSAGQTITCALFQNSVGAQVMDNGFAQRNFITIARLPD